LKIIKIGLTIIAATCLSGCLQPYGKNTKINIKTAAYLNPDVYGKPAPIAITVYELNSQMDFNKASYSQLYNSASDILKNSLIDLHPYTIKPGVNESLSIDVSKQAKYIGIAAGYRRINNANWKKLIPISNLKTVNLKVDLESENLIVTIQN
jgi:type VI secretion system protein VasD